MGNALRVLCRYCQRPTTAEEPQVLGSQGFLAFYGLPYVPQTIEEDVKVTTIWPEVITPPWPEGVQFELLTLPVDKRAIGDGDGFTAYVNITEPRELKHMPQNVIDAIIMKENARDAKYFKLEKLIKKSVIASGYRFLKLPNQQKVLAHKYRIRLRGVDAPEIGMVYGDEATHVLVKMIQGKCLKIHVYNKDIYGRSVGDVYYNDIFIQEQLLKRGCVWHYVAYDRRPEFAKWQKEARDARRGLWLYQILRGKIIPIHLNTEEKPLFCSQILIQ